MTLTTAQKRALKWLRNRNSDGVFETNNSVLIAAGERAPITRSTWNHLLKAGYVEVYAKRRLRMTEEGLKLDLTDVSESTNEHEVIP